MAIQPTTPVSAQFVTTQTAAAGKAGASSPLEATPPPASPPAAQRADEEAAATSGQATDPEALRQAVERAQNALPPKARGIAFSMNEKTNTVVVKIIDRESEEVIRQIPSEEFLKIAEALNEQIDDIRSGLLVQQKA
jgi:flagellar protein FlaG